MRRLSALVGAAAALAAGATIAGIETYWFPGVGVLFGIVGALALGHAAKTLGVLGLTRPAAREERTDDE